MADSREKVLSHNAALLVTVEVAPISIQLVNQLSLDDNAEEEKQRENLQRDPIKIAEQEKQQLKNQAGGIKAELESLNRQIQDSTQNSDKSSLLKSLAKLFNKHSVLLLKQIGEEFFDEMELLIGNTAGSVVYAAAQSGDMEILNKNKRYLFNWEIFKNVLFIAVVNQKLNVLNLCLQLKHSEFYNFMVFKTEMGGDHLAEYVAGVEVAKQKLSLWDVAISYRLFSVTSYFIDKGYPVNIMAKEGNLWVSALDQLIQAAAEESLIRKILSAGASPLKRNAFYFDAQRPNSQQHLALPFTSSLTQGNASLFAANQLACIFHKFLKNVIFSFFSRRSLSVNLFVSDLH